MPQGIEHRRWAGYDPEKSRRQEQQPDNPRQIDAGTPDQEPG